MTQNFEQVTELDRNISVQEANALLEERKVYDQWLAKLDEGEDDHSGRIYGKVRDDYLSRIAGVDSKLQTKQPAIESQLQRLKEKCVQLGEIVAALEFAIQEAQLRAAVGEFSESEFEYVEREKANQILQKKTTLEEIFRDRSVLTNALRLAENARSGPDPEENERVAKIGI